MPDNCEFCWKLEHRGQDCADFRIVEQTAMNSLVAARGPVTPGHLLVVPRRHLSAWAYATDEERSDATSLMDTAVAFLRDSYSAPVVMFENGGDGCSSSGGCVGHAHLNLVSTTAPRPRFLNRAILADRRSLEGWHRLRGTTYSVWADSMGTFVGFNVPSRSLRRHVMQWHDSVEYEDYFLFPNIELVREVEAKYAAFRAAVI